MAVILGFALNPHQITKLTSKIDSACQNHMKKRYYTSFYVDWFKLYLYGGHLGFMQMSGVPRCCRICTTAGIDQVTMKYHCAKFHACISIRTILLTNLLDYPLTRGRTQRNISQSIVKIAVHNL